MPQPRLTKEQRKRILDRLAATYPDAKCELDHTSPFELLVATILSAQCTDARVNMVTARLFAKYNTPEQLAELSPEELAEHIKELGLFRSKAKNLVAMAQMLLSEHGGEVPNTREALERLPGVGRKTANVVLSNAFGVPAIAVDTHVFRVANRLGLAQAKNVTDTETQLMACIPKDLWSPAHHWLIHHGRRLCHARKPNCKACPLRDDCLHFQSAQVRSTQATARPRPAPQSAAAKR